MKRARFTEGQIIAVLKDHEAGAKTADLARNRRATALAFATRAFSELKESKRIPKSVRQ